MNRRLLKSILILPGTALVYVPGLLIWAAHGTRFAAHPAARRDEQLWIGLLVGAAGMALMAWTMRIFATVGRGTPAPWDPPQRLVVLGPYRHVRNPMITGVVLALLAETLVLQSWPIAVWMVVFLMVAMAYSPLSEEKGLEARFGADYRAYKQNVPRWIPNLKPWSPPDG